MGLKTSTRERRRGRRSGFFRGRKLSIDWRGQVLAAKVVDSSDQGLGVEMSAPLEVDSVVSFTGVRLQGRAQVKNCRRNDDGLFRVGLNLVSSPEFALSSGAHPSKTVQVHDPPDRLRNAGAIEEPNDRVADNLVNGVKEMHSDTQESREAKSQDNGSAPAMSQIAGESRQKGTALTSAELSGLPGREGEASARLSEMAQNISQAVEVALLNLELHRQKEINAVKQELEDSKLKEILQGWPETQQQIAELKTNASEQQAGVAATKDTLSQLCAATETAQRRQGSRVDSTLERLTVQEAELPKLKDSIEDLLGKLNAVVQRLDSIAAAWK